MHGTRSRYQRGCRCQACKATASDYALRRKQGLDRIDDQALRDFLLELCPDGLTDDCPARNPRRTAHAS